MDSALLSFFSNCFLALGQTNVCALGSYLGAFFGILGLSVVSCLSGEKKLLSYKGSLEKDYSFQLL